MVRILSINIGIIGAGPAGMAAALYLKRSGLNPTILEKSAPGGQMVNTFKIENYLGFNEINGADLALKMYEQLKYQKINYKTFDVKNIKKEKSKFIISSAKENMEFDKIIIATGKKRRKLGLLNEDKLKGISYCAICDGNFYKGKTVAVIGGGNSALTEAIYLSNICQKVYLIVRNEIRAQDSLQREVKQKQNIEIINQKEIISLNGELFLESITLNDNNTLNIDGLFISIGGTPNNDFIFDLNIELKEGSIVVNENMETTEKGVYACGDIILKKHYQIATAINDGVIAALSISEGNEA